MVTKSEYLENLSYPGSTNQVLALDSPLPLEVSGGSGNWVASWMETGIEGEGKSIAAAMEDCSKSIVERYHVLDKKRQDSVIFREEEERIWISMCHYIVHVARGRTRPGEEFLDKGPVFG
jgi:hypothetical protein